MQASAGERTPAFLYNLRLLRHSLPVGGGKFFSGLSMGCLSLSYLLFRYRTFE